MALHFHAWSINISTINPLHLFHTLPRTQITLELVPNKSIHRETSKLSEVIQGHNRIGPYLIHSTPNGNIHHVLHYILKRCAKLQFTFSHIRTLLMQLDWIQIRDRSLMMSSVGGGGCRRISHDNNLKKTLQQYPKQKQWRKFCFSLINFLGLT